MSLFPRTAVALVFSFTLSVDCCAQASSAADPEIVADRPDVTESSIVVPAASLQFENGFTWTDDHGTRAADFTQTLMRLGLLARTEFRLVVPNYFYSAGPIPSEAGFGDIAIGMKQQLGPLLGGIDLSVIFAVSVPTGASGVSTGGYDPLIKFPWSKELTHGWSIGGMQSLFWNTDGDRRNGLGTGVLFGEPNYDAP